MAKKRLSKDDRRIQLLDAAAKLFGKSSYGQVTTAELAKACGKGHFSYQVEVEFLPS